MPPNTVCKPQAHYLIADWLGFMEPAPLGEKGEKTPSPDHNSFFYMYNSIKMGTQAMIPRVDTATHGVQTPPPLADS